MCFGNPHYKSAWKVAFEEADYLSRLKKNKEFISSKYENKRNVFSVVVFESDGSRYGSENGLSYCDECWMLEFLFRQYIAIVTTSRLIEKAKEDGLLMSKMSYKDFMDDLSPAWRKVDSPQ